MNKLQRQVYKLNLDYFYENFLNQKAWDKEWTIFSYDGLVITIQLHSIEIMWDRIYLRVIGVLDDLKTFELLQLPLGNRNNVTSTQSLHAKVFNIIEHLERSLIRATDVYHQASDMDIELERSFEDEAIDILDDEGVQNEDIRAAYIESYVGDQDLNKYTDEVEDFLRYQYLSSKYLAYALYVQDDGKYNFYKGHLNGGETLDEMIKDKCNELFGDELEME